MSSRVILYGTRADGTIAPIQLDSSNNIDVTGSGGGGGGAIGAGTSAAAGRVVVATDQTAIPVTIPGGISVTPAQDTRATGTINAATLNATYAVAANGQATLGVLIAGLTSSAATLVLEGSYDGGTTWTSIVGDQGGTGILLNTFTTDTQFRSNMGARTNARLRVSVVGTGTITCTSVLSPVSSLVAISTPIPPGSNAIGSVSVSNLPATQAVTGAVAVSNLPVTQAISATALPLPTGAAQDATLGTIGTTPPTLPGGSTGIIGLLRYIGTLFASLITTATGTASRVVLVDPVSGNGSLVQAFHNSDNQMIGATSYGLFTGGVDQIVNGTGNLDRKRGVAGDAMAVTGLAAEVPMLFNGTTYDRAPGSALRGQDVSFKPTASAVNALTPVVTSALASSLVLKASAGNLYGFQVTNGATAGYVMLFNATTAPADGAVTPVKVYQMAANTSLNASVGSGPPTAFSTGIVVAYSSTGPFTKTASATAFIAGDVA